MMCSPTGETVQRKSRSQVGADDLNSPIFEWKTTEVTRVAVAPGGFRDIQGHGRDSEDIRYTLLLPPGTKAEASDRWVVRGEELTTVGAPAVWASPWGHGRGVVVEVREVPG